MRARTYNIMQYEKHPVTGEILITQETILKAVEHKTIKRYAYVCHDRDVYSEADEANDDTGHIKAGNNKPRHWHIVLECPSNPELSAIAKWFEIPDNFIDVPKGKGSFLDCVQYLTHESENEQAKDKALYSDDEIISNFDFRTELDKRTKDRKTYGQDLSAKDKMRYDVLYLGKTLKQCKQEDKILYMNDAEKLKKFRLEYISELDPPATRINYYISGSGGAGKGLLSRAIARNLFPELKSDSDIFFEVGAKGVAFEGYDGQPVIIWSDRRAIDLLLELNGRGNVFNVFDPHPTRQKQNIKFGNINLCNVVNIVNSVQPYREFLDGLAGEYTDKDGSLVSSEIKEKVQSYRRFQFVIDIHDNDFTFYKNAFFSSMKNYLEYINHGNIKGNFQRIAERCASNHGLARKIEAQTVKAVVEEYKLIHDSHDFVHSNEKDIEKEFSDFGEFERVGVQMPLPHIFDE